MARRSSRFDGTTADRGKSAGCCGLLQSTVDKVIDFLDPVFTRYGYLFSVKSDNGQQFVPQVFKDILVKRGIDHRISQPLWPQANWEVQRHNRTLLKVFKVAQVKGK